MESSSFAKVLTMVASLSLRMQGRYHLDTIQLFETIGIICGCGIPLIIGVVFICVRPNGKLVFGPSGMWCQVTNPFNVERLAVYYGPIWYVQHAPAGCQLTPRSGILLFSIILLALSARQVLIIRANVKLLQSEGILEGADKDFQ